MSISLKKNRTFLATILSFFITFSLAAPSAHAQPPLPPAPEMGWSSLPSAGYRSWFSVAASSDGSTIIAGTSEGSIQISHDSGLTWDAELARRFGAAFEAVTVSSNGMNMAVASQDGDIWTSADSGSTWTDRILSGSNHWFALAASSDGSRLVAGTDFGTLIESLDFGATWSEISIPGEHGWFDIAMSSDGQKIIASDYPSQRIFISSDWGISWQVHLAGLPVAGVTSSSDGTNLAVGIVGGDIFTSSDSGQTWVDRTNSGSRLWVSLSSSYDGSTIIAGIVGTGVYLSRDYGQSWKEQTWFGTGLWIALATVGDGHRMFAGSYEISSYLGTYYLPYSSSTLRSLTPAAISMDQNEITCSSGNLSYAHDGESAVAATLTSASFRLVSSTGVAATSTSIGAFAHFARSSLASGERYTCQIVAIEKDAMISLSTEDLSLKEKVLQTERADLAVVVSTYYQARAAALTAKNAAVAALMASDDHSNRGDRLTQILESYHRAIDQALSNKEMATKAAHGKSAATLATAGVSVVN